MNAGLSLDERMALRSPLTGDDLSGMAARLYPESDALQRKWLHAVAVVRATPRGWLLDARVTKQDRHARQAG